MLSRDILGLTLIRNISMAKVKGGMQETMYRVIQNSRIFLNIMFETVMNKNFRVLKSFSSGKSKFNDIE